jgi:hypothetical protein
MIPKLGMTGITQITYRTLDIRLVPVRHDGNNADAVLDIAWRKSVVATKVSMMHSTRSACVADLISYSLLRCTSF